MVCLLAFALPPVLRLQQVSPMRVIRGDLAGDGLPVWMSYGAGGLGCLLLLVWYSGSLQLTAWVLSGVAVVVVMLMAIAWVLLRSTRVLGMQAGSAWRLAAAALRTSQADTASTRGTGATCSLGGVEAAGDPGRRRDMRRPAPRQADTPGMHRSPRKRPGR